MTFFCRIWYLDNADCEKKIPINEWDGTAMQSNTDHRKVALTQTGMATQFTATASCAMNHLLHRTENSLSFFSAPINNTGGLCLVCKPAGIQKKKNNNNMKPRDRDTAKTNRHVFTHHTVQEMTGHVDCRSERGKCKPNQTKQFR